MQGVILSPPDERDYLVRQIAPELPKSVSLENLFTVRDQLFCGTCVGKAGAGILSAFKSAELSSLYIYRRCKELDGLPMEGTYPRVALKVMQKDGSCPDYMLPYSKLKACLLPPAITEEQQRAAEEYRIDSYARCYSNSEIKQALANGQLIMAVILCGDNFMEYKSGVVGPPTGELHGYHCVILCGYDDDKQAFRGVNSWSEGWGEDGLFWLDYKVSLPEAWAVNATKTNMESDQPMDSLLERIKSRKFILAVVSAIIVLANDGLGWNLPEETITSFVLLILGFIFTEGAADVVSRFKH